MDRAVTEWHIPVIGKEKGRVLKPPPRQARAHARHRGRLALRLLGDPDRGQHAARAAGSPASRTTRTSRGSASRTPTRPGSRAASRWWWATRSACCRSCAAPSTSCCSTRRRRTTSTTCKAVEPRLVKGALVVADNTGIFRRDVKPYLDHVRGGAPCRAANTTSAPTAWKSPSSAGSRNVRGAPRPRVPQAPLRAHGDPPQARHRHHRRLPRAAVHPRRAAGGAAAPLRRDPRQDQGLAAPRAGARARRADVRRSLQGARGDGSDAGGARLLLHVFLAPPGHARERGPNDPALGPQPAGADRAGAWTSWPSARSSIPA